MIATSGTAFTEQQVAMLKRHTSQVVVNFDPDAAGINAAEKSIALLTEEGFTIKIVTLDGGLDPDRYIRERGVEAYTEALRGARRQADYLIERARLLFPGASSEQKVKAMNYLLPHIRRMPEKLARDQFAADAAQKLGIDSAVLREELRQAALRRRDHVEVREPQRSPRSSGYCCAPWPSTTRSLSARGGWPSRPLPSNPLGLSTLAPSRPSRRWPAPGQRPHGRGRGRGAACLAGRGAAGRDQAPEQSEVQSAIQEIQERAIESRQRDLRALIAEAERRGDFAELALLTQQKLDLDRALRQLHNRKAAYNPANPCLRRTAGAPMILELKPAQQKMLDRAARSGMSPEEVLDQAFAVIQEQYRNEDWILADKEAIAAQIAEGFAQAERGELVDADQAIASFRSAGKAAYRLRNALILPAHSAGARRS